MPVCRGSGWKRVEGWQREMSRPAENTIKAVFRGPVVQTAPACSSLERCAPAAPPPPPPPPSPPPPHTRTTPPCSPGRLQGTQAAQALWHTHGKPAISQGLAFARTKSAQLNAAIEARAGDSWPKAKAAVGAAWKAAHKAALQAWHSPALAAVRPALAKGYAQAAEQAAKVQGELEQLLIRCGGG